MTSSGVIYRRSLALLHECETICIVYFFSTLLASTFVELRISVQLLAFVGYFGPTCACVTLLSFFSFPDDHCVANRPCVLFIHSVFCTLQC